MTTLTFPTEVDKLKLVANQKKIMRYAIWNNKGGVGKTFLTFMMASEYAIANPKTNVVILDLCPQANVSEIVLGGNGSGAQALGNLLNQKQRMTIGGYFDERLNSPQTPTKKGADYLINPLQMKYNLNLSDNLFIIAGDPSLELQAQTINQISAQTLPENSWKNVHLWVVDLIDDIKTKLGNDTMFFIDCNPSFASYTELAILASERLIVPCSADGSSARAIDNIGRLVYGIHVAKQYQTANFYGKAQSYDLALPYIHIVSMNRSTQFDNRASRSFSAMFMEIQTRVGNLQKANVPFTPISNEDRFIDIPDAHAVSIVCSHEGVPLSKLKLGLHDINGVSVQVNEEPVDRYRTALTKLISVL